MGQASFNDYYENLQVSPKADQETIERVYRLLAKKYHPDNPATGRVETFEIITDAYRTLADPQRRAAYDATYDEGKSRQWRSISRAFGGQGFESDRTIRRTILSILYTRRREDPAGAGVGIVHLENLMEWPGETLDFHMWYLKEKGLVDRTDNGGFEITAAGVDQIESEGLVLRNDRLLTQAGQPLAMPERARLLEAVN